MGRQEQRRRCDDELALRAASRIGRRIGSDKVIDDRDLLEAYAGDESHLEPELPAAALRVQTVEDVVATVEVASELGVPLTARGGGTGKSGGAIPTCGGLVLVLAGLNEILEINRDDLIARARPGVITGTLHEAVESEGLFYPPDPGSLETCALGGNVAENAGGPRAFKYGVTGTYVLGMEVVVPPGRRLRVGRQTVKGVAGYDLSSLLVGSEGTLGVFTELTFRLIPRPQAVRTLMALFSDPLTAGRAVSAMVERGLVPRVLEFLDGDSVDVLRKARKIPIPSSAGAMLLVEVDGDEGHLEAEVERVAEACEAQGAVEILATQTAAEARELWAARRELSELMSRAAAHKLSDDICVPRSALSEMLLRSARIGDRQGVRVATYGHAGDGNLHVNVLWDHDDVVEAERALEMIVTEAVALGGTITGEHGVGSAKRHLLGLEQSAELIELQRQLKSVFDPKGILNPGKIFPE